MNSETVLSLAIGIALAAATGFRVFVPLLVMSIAAFTGHLSLASGFEWIGSPAALIAFGAATAAEVAGYYIPWVDNLLDVVATPAAVIAGTVVVASSVVDMSPFLRWSLAIIAGGGVAGLVQSFTGLTRVASTTTTGGIANPFLSTAETGGSIILSVLALLLPLVALVLVAVVIFAALRTLYRRLASG